ncbi:MAG: bacitracin resistance protein [Leifsonia sp.]
MSAVPEETAVDRSPRTPLWLAVALAIVFGLFYAYDVFEALGNILGISDFATSLDASINVFGWVLLVLALVLPLAIFATAFTMGRHRGPLVQVVFYAVGLGLSAVLSLDIIAAFARWIPIG